MVPFIYPVNLLSQSREILFKPLSFSTYKSLIKTIVNDVNSSESFFNRLISNLSIEKNIKFTALDKFYILLFIYGTNISTVIKFNLTCPDSKKIFSYDLNLANLLESIDKLSLKHFIDITLEGITYQFSLPQKMITDGNIVRDCLVQIKYEDQIIKVTNDITKQIPFIVISKFNRWLEEQEKLLQTINFIDTKSPHSPETIIRLPPSFYNQSLFNFLITVFRDDLRQIYMTEYDLVNNQNFTFQDFEKITPAEVEIYLNIKNKLTTEQPKQPSLPSSPPPTK